MEKIKFSEKQKKTILMPYDHCLEVNEGSPRSGKTFATIARFALHLIESKDLNHLVVAYSSELAFRLVIEGDGFGLKYIFSGCCKISHDDNGNHLVIDTPNGEKRVYWKGGGKADAYKALTGMSLGSVYFCEINLLHMSMIQECFRRTFAAESRWHIADLNPPAPQHPVISEVFEVQDTLWQHWTCADNPILTPQRLKEIEESCKKSKFLYTRDWLGERCLPEGVIYWMFDINIHVLRSIPEEYKAIEFYFSGDGGTTDATSIDAWVVAKRDGDKNATLFHIGTWYYDGKQKAMSEQAKDCCNKFIPRMREKAKMKERNIFIDPACKALRLEFDRLGYMTSKADNNAHDSVGATRGLMCGIEMLQSGLQDRHVYFVDDDVYGIEPTVKEMGLYCMGNNGVPVDAYNHNMDSLRYGYNYFAKKYGFFGSPIKIGKKPLGI